MKIISHRGHWLAPHEKNTGAAFARSFSAGFGTETDVRDQAGELVISHDPPVGDCLTLPCFLDDFVSYAGALGMPLAVNVKADGLAVLLRDAFVRHPGLDWFVFDMSVPDTRQQLRAGNPVFVRLSDHEPSPPWLDVAAGVWLDAFDTDWYDAATVQSLLERGLRVCVVSAELQGREPSPLWHVLRPLARHDGLILCTDRPQDAAAFFPIRP